MFTVELNVSVDVEEMDEDWRRPTCPVDEVRRLEVELEDTVPSALGRRDLVVHRGLGRGAQPDEDDSGGE